MTTTFDSNIIMPSIYVNVLFFDNIEEILEWETKNTELFESLGPE